MDITPLIPKGRQVIEKYGNGGFVISGMPHKGNILLLADKVLAWDVAGFASLTAESFSPLFTDGLPEIILIGAGARFMPLPPQMRDHFRAKEVSVDIMDTGAACRTYTVLLAEGRQVAAALIAV